MYKELRFQSIIECVSDGKKYIYTSNELVVVYKLDTKTKQPLYFPKKLNINDNEFDKCCYKNCNYSIGLILTLIKFIR